ncbi:glutaredoxin 2 [Neokomagataea anthophila]|uniref:Glutaredoxin 2 n=1 Tax=Neokomagataea anthophila TaxID=2826925 RepID=A0ABS5E4M4_9PROT|nr:glutaredoxin 2 [Neokomagataea anthophila]MBR0558854.1 glutaredoxin 2 [Neokomagataea anthophila]
MSSALPILHVYEHCPFCVKARMIFGLHALPFEKRIFLHDDTTGPTEMVGRKVVPILEENGTFMPESLDIIAHIEKSAPTPLLTGPLNDAITQWLSSIAAPAYKLLIPRVASAPFPEFSTTSARANFIRRKERAEHPFGIILDNSTDDIQHINQKLLELAPLIQSPSAVNGTLSYDDLHLFAQLRSLSLIRGIHYPVEVDAYRHTMSERARVPLLEVFAV